MGFQMTPGGLSIEGVPPIEDWETLGAQLFHMQRNVPWWIGDMLAFGEARFGDDIMQCLPEDVSLEMVERFASVSRKFPIGDRNPSLSWTHHVIALRANEKLRAALLRVAERERMDTKEFTAYVNQSMRARQAANAAEGN